MKHLLRTLPILLLILGLQVQAQVAPAPASGVKGKFFVSVDDRADIFVNGAELHKAPIGESESPEIELKPGDRIIAKLTNVASKRRFMLMFMSTDRTQMISFTPTSFKILTDATAKDFDPVEFARNGKQAKAIQGDFAKPYLLPFKSNSKWIWGDLDICSLGCLVTLDLFKPNTHR
jgi:hypothetical protein